MPAIPHPDPPLADARVSVRPSAERDIPEILIAYQDDHELATRLGQARAPTGADLGRADELANADRVNGVRLALTISAPATDVCVGQVVVHRIDWDNLRAGLLVWVAPQARRRGYASAALRLVASWLFAATELARLEIFCDPDNAAMLAAGAAAGFQREGILRGYRAGRAGRRDAAVLSRLPGDPA